MNFHAMKQKLVVCGKQRWKENRISMLVCLGLIVGVLFGTTVGYAISHKTVNLMVDGEKKQVKTFETNVAKVLNEADVILNEADEVVPSGSEKLKEGMEIKIIRAFGVQVQVDGQGKQVLTTKKKVGDILTQGGIELGINDKTEPDREAVLAQGQGIQVIRVKQETLVEKCPIAFETGKRNDSSMLRGTQKVLKKGVQGEKEITYLITYEDGKETQREVQSENVIREPKEQILAIGTKYPGGYILTSRGDTKYRRMASMVATAYAPNTKTAPNSHTYLGMKAARGVVAVDPKVIPLRSRVYIPGYGIAIAGDIGSAIKGNRIDLCFDTYSEAKRYGRRRVKVYLLE